MRVRDQYGIMRYLCICGLIFLCASCASGRHSSQSQPEVFRVDLTDSECGGDGWIGLMFRDLEGAYAKGFPLKLKYKGKVVWEGEVEKGLMEFTNVRSGWYEMEVLVHGDLFIFKPQWRQQKKETEYKGFKIPFVMN